MTPAAVSPDIRTPSATRPKVSAINLNEADINLAPSCISLSNKSPVSEIVLGRLRGCRREARVSESVTPASSFSVTTKEECETADEEDKTSRNQCSNRD
jgi:hypothetical protein